MCNFLNKIKWNFFLFHDNLLYEAPIVINTHWYASALIWNTKLMEPRELISGSRLRLTAGILSQFKNSKHFCLIINSQQTNCNKSLDLTQLESPKWAVICLSCVQNIKVIPAKHRQTACNQPKNYWMKRLALHSSSIFITLWKWTSNISWGIVRR